MAKPTRQQRRARREAQAASAPKAVGRGPSTGADGAAVVPTPRAEAEPRSVPGRGTKRFVGESWAELKKVEWPSQNQVIQGTVVVLVACVIVGVYLWGADQVFQRLVQKVFLR